MGTGRLTVRSCLYEQYEYSLDYCFTHTDHVVGVVLQIFMKFWMKTRK